MPTISLLKTKEYEKFKNYACGLMVRHVQLMVLLVFCNISSVCLALTDKELVAVQAGFESRSKQMLTEQMVQSCRPLSGRYGLHQYILNKFDFAMAALYLNKEIGSANNAIMDACKELSSRPAESRGELGLHWGGNHLIRIYLLFNGRSKFFPGRLTPESEAAICKALWDWARYEAHIKDTEFVKSKTWYIWESENHDAMHDATAWGAALILKDCPPYNTYRYEDGSTANQQLAAWTDYLKEYICERAKKGLCVEIASGYYGQYTLQSWYNYSDFSDDSAMRSLAKSLLDLWWAEWAQEQIEGIRGGSKSRVYQGKFCQYGTPAWDYLGGWFYLGVGAGPVPNHGTMCLATSLYRMPLVVMDIALDVAGKGSYECFSRKMGLNIIPRPKELKSWLEDRIYALDPNCGGILRYTYCTPDFIIGTSMLPKKDLEDYSYISSQNRWHGIIFRGDPNARIFPQCVALSGSEGKRTTYNEQWSVQNKGTLITQKLSTSKDAGDMRIWFASCLNRIEEDGWVFVRTENAFAAVRPAYGGYTWDDENWLRCKEQYAPIIMEVTCRRDFETLGRFKSAVLTNPILIRNDVLIYAGLLGSGTFKFYFKSVQTPEINDVPVNYAPNYAFKSPFVNESWASGIVTISKDSRKQILSFKH
jgi:hypothetical protein